MLSRSIRIALATALLSQSGCSLLFFGDERADDYRSAFVPADDAGITDRAPPEPVFDAFLESHSFPGEMQVGQRRNVSLTIRNAGNQPWTDDGLFLLNSVNDPKLLWGVGTVTLEEEVQPNESAVFEFEITATATTGSFEHAWQVARRKGSSVVSIGDAIRVSVDVVKLDAAVVQQDLPSLVRPGDRAPATITLRNSGDRPWAASAVRLVTEQTHWSTTAISLDDDVPVGGAHTFAVDVIGPDLEGTIDSIWQLEHEEGNSRFLFGEEAVTRNIEVTACGDGVVQAHRGELCDDGNRVGGDNCDATCAVEPVIIDLSIQSADRSFFGSDTNYAMGNVAVADVIGDRRPNILMGEGFKRLDLGRPRARVGRVLAYDVGLDFFDPQTPIMTPADRLFEILGADVDDNLGATKLGSLQTFLFRRGAVPDIVASAPGAGGINNDRADAGEIYIFRSGTGLLHDGDVIDTATSSEQLSGRIVGTEGVEIVIIDAGDLTGDGTIDLVVGARGDDSNALEAGAAYVIDGTLVHGEIDLSNLSDPAIVAVVYGPAGGDRLGQFGAVGDVNGDGIDDLFLGTSNHSRPGRSEAGAVWGMFGPLRGTINLALQEPDLAIFGPIENADLGLSVKIGHVVGSTVAHLVVGGPQVRSGGSQTGAILVWEGPLRAGVIDLGDSPSRPADLTIFGADPNDRLGATLAIGDTNADGFGDIIAAAPHGNGPANMRVDAGELLIIFGGPSLPAEITLGSDVPALIVYGATTRDRIVTYNNNLAVADVNKDGADDLVFGSPFWGANREGRVDIVLSPWAPPK